MDERKIVSKDQLIGSLILIASVAGIGVYAWLLYAYALIILQATAFIAVAAILGILGILGHSINVSSLKKVIYLSSSPRISLSHLLRSSLTAFSSSSLKLSSFSSKDARAFK